MSSRFRHHIPQEICDEVMSHADLGTVSICSLVCKSWCIFSQALLFREVFIGRPWDCEIGEQPQSRCQQLISLLAVSPHLGRYVLQLALDDDVPISYNNKLSSIYVSDSWMNQDGALIPLLDSLQDLREFELTCGRTEDAQAVVWSIYTEELQAALSRLLRRPSLTAVKLDLNLEIPMPTKLLESLQKLKSLTLSSFKDATSAEDAKQVAREASVGATHDRPTLSTLRLLFTHFGSGAVDWLLSDRSPVKVDQLERLKVTVASLSDQEYASRLLRANGETLRRLTLDIGSLSTLFLMPVIVILLVFPVLLVPSPFPFEGISLAQCRGLVHLKMYFQLTHWAVIRLLDTAGKASALETLTLMASDVLDLPYAGRIPSLNSEVQLHFHDRNGLKELDSFLGGDSFPSLKRINYSAQLPRGVSPQVFKEVVGREMAQSVTKGIIVVATCEQKWGSPAWV